MSERREFFIQASDKQMLGAILAKFTIERETGGKYPVHMFNVHDEPLFKTYVGKSYRRVTERRTFEPDDLQFFTLTRFMPPEFMNFEGKAIVIDPDIFALKDVSRLFDIDLEDKSLAACRKKNDWDSSVMMLDCSKLGHWKIKDILDSLVNNEVGYEEWMELRHESVKEIDRIWNNLDTLTPDTKFIHTTRRLTQPWKTGLPIDFTRNKMPKLFGVIPREWVHKLLGKYPTHYQPHPNKAVEDLFFNLLKEAMDAGVVDEAFLRNEMSKNHIRHDTLDKLKNLTTS